MELKKQNILCYFKHSLQRKKAVLQWKKTHSLVYNEITFQILYRFPCQYL